MNYGDIALGMLLSLVGWAVFLVVVLPYYLRRLRAEIVSDIPEMVKKTTPLLKKELKLDFGGIIKQVSDRLKDPDDKEFREMIAMFAFYVSGAAMDLLENDEHTKAFFRGFINKEAETFFKSVKTRMTTEAASYGIDLGQSSEGAGVEPNPEMAKMFNLFQVFGQLKKALGGV